MEDGNPIAITLECNRVGTIPKPYHSPRNHPIRILRDGSAESYWLDVSGEEIIEYHAPNAQCAQWGDIIDSLLPDGVQYDQSRPTARLEVWVPSARKIRAEAVG